MMDTGSTGMPARFVPSLERVDWDAVSAAKRASLPPSRSRHVRIVVDHASMADKRAARRRMARASRKANRR